MDIFPSLHTEPFEVSFVQTTYTFFEGGGPVEVCINLTRPGTDINVTVRVHVINDETSIYIPVGARLASE